MGDFALKVIRKLLTPVYRRIDYQIAAVPLESCMNGIDDLEKDFKFRPIEKADLSEIGTEFGDNTRLKFKVRLERGEQGCLVLDAKGEIIGYTWVTHQTVINEGIPPFTFNIVPEDRHIYFYDAFIATGMRNSGGITALLTFLLQQSAIDGFKLAFWLVDSRNQIMRKISLKLGCQIDGEIRYRRYLTYVKKDMKALSKFCK
jgi:hypothetical protein